MILMRELLRASHHTGCISRLRTNAEIQHGLMAVLPCEMEHTDRLIGLTIRKDWKPTMAQKLFLDIMTGGHFIP